MTVDIDVENIDKNDKNTWKTYTRKWMQLILEGLNYLPKHLLITLESIRTSHRHLNWNKWEEKNRLRRNFIYAGGYGSFEKNGPDGKKWQKQFKTCFKDSLQDRSIGLVLILSGYKKRLVQDNLSFTRDCFKAIFKVNLDQNILYLMLLL